jgi:N utilization substance protein B
MANRHLARSIIMQTLFEWDFSGRNNEKIPDSLNHNIEEFGPGLDDGAFMMALTKGVVTKHKVIDEIIEKAAPEWPVDKISAVDRNVLRLGLYELLFGDYTDVPPKVAINEAIELAKSYGGENSGRFINGVLGAVYREMGEPGKDQIIPKKKQQQAPINLEELPVEKKAGAVVFAKKDDQIFFALVHDVFGYWTLAKGGIDDIDDEIAGVKREVKEEIDIDIDVLEKLGENEYIANHPKNGKIRKQVHYFLTSAEYQELHLDTESGGLDDAKWFPMEEIAELTMYEDITKLLATAIEKITKLS